MKQARVQSYLALIVVGAFVSVAVYLALFPVITSQAVKLDEYSDFYIKMVAPFTGITGLILGYYFGRSSKGSEEPE
jgi:hypothetical protein